MRADIERWNQKYRSGDQSVTPAGEPELVAMESHLPRQGDALELASGKGANALYLASLGLNVTAMDGSIEGLKICAREAADRGLLLQPVVVDLDQISLPTAKFDMVSVVRYLNRDLFAALYTALKPGGILFYKTFNLRHLAHRPGFNPHFLLRDDELTEAFAALELIDHGESSGSSYIIGRRPA